MIFDDIKETLELLKDHRLGIISNGNAFQQNLKLVINDIDKYFEIKIFSEEAGYSKPDNRIFNMAKDYAREEIIYVGDNIKTDIIPCIDLNIKCFLIDRNSINSDKPYSIRSLKELID